MSVLTPKRVFLCVAVVLSLASSAFAGHPAARTYARMVFDPEGQHTVLFGGEGSFDVGTQLIYDSAETWTWGGSRWTQVFPATSPTARAAHGMVYDSIGSRIVLFGGRQQKTSIDGKITLFNDTWVWDGGNWSEIHTPNAPDPRHLFGMAFDSARNRIVLYGGSHYAADGETFEALGDTWEFDGTTWTKIAVATEPKVNYPQLAYDAARNQVIMIGSDDTVATAMYAYDPVGRAWNKLTPEKLPSCANDSSVVYRPSTQTVVLTGGVCNATTSVFDSTWEWNGTNWTETVTTMGRSTATAIAYDAVRDAIALYGGFPAFSSVPTPATTVLQNKVWRFAVADFRPSPRSLSSFTSDPVKNTVWLYGGLFDQAESFSNELWGYRNNQWFPLVVDSGPPSCEGPLGAYDTNRSRLVIVCFGANLFEFDGEKWTSIAPKDNPADRRFAAVAYDENLKKVVLFGGFDGANYRNDTWTWDGTNWTEVKNNKPTARGLMAMWYDPLLKKTVIYGGLGRKSINERITRYDDMYSFDGNGWTKLNVTNTPGERMGAQFAIDQNTKKLILFGGLRSVLDTATDTRRQFFDNDTWQWDGASSTWTRLEPANAPVARQNGVMAWDPVAHELVLFGGYAGFYYSDTWAFNGTNWVPRSEGSGRRRAAHPPREPVTPVINPGQR